MPDLRFLNFILYVCIGSNIFVTVGSIMGGYRKVNSEGVVFDIIYSIICSLNLASDVIMLNALKKPREPETKIKLRLFLMWNAGTMCASYVTDLFLSDFISKHTDLKKEQLENTDEDTARAALFHLSMIVSTIIFLVKCSVLFGIYQVYTNYEQLAAEDHTEAVGERGPLFAPAEPAAFRFEPGSQQGVAVEGPVRTATTTPPPAVPHTVAPGWGPMTPAFFAPSQGPGQPYYVTFQQPRFPIEQQRLAQPQMYPGADPRVVYMPYYADVASSQPMLGQPIIVVEHGLPARATSEVSTAQPAVGEPTAAQAVVPQEATPHDTRLQATLPQDTQVPAATAQGTTAPDVQTTAGRAMSPQDTHSDVNCAVGTTAKATSAPVPTATAIATQPGPVESTTSQAAPARATPVPRSPVDDSADRNTPAESVAGAPCFGQEKQTVDDQPTDEARQKSRRFVDTAGKTKE